MKQKKVIIFDLGGVYFTDGTTLALKKIKKLVDVPEKAVDEVFRSAYKKEGYLYRKGKLTKKQFWSRAAEKLNVSKNEIEKIRKLWLESYKPKKESVKFIRKLGKKYKLVVLSGQTKERIKYLDKKYMFKKDFDRLFFSFDLKSSKLDKALYKKFLQKLKEKPENCIFIDDGMAPVKAARSFGMKTILFKNIHQLERDLQKDGVMVK